ncbi:serine/threonine-protein kinase [Actinoplanes sp. NPDC051346]|uniref:serine/threonine-protein kinase n=1 Tax=Actinoplanes sp. NPDC051346 TaxID=3155048 RepID=UPI00341FB424
MNEKHWTVRVDEGYRVGPWQVTQGLASGSWSSVYAAVHEGTTGESTRAALKFLPTGTLTPRQLSHLAAMTDRELAVHRQLRHPHVIAVLGTYVVDDRGHPDLDGATVIAMELAERSAAAALRDAGGGGLPEAPRLIEEICAGLAGLHESGWVHGDLKPSNILLMADGSVRLADFGLSAELDGTHAYLPPGGSADHMPPERWGEGITADGTVVRQSADIWALGVTACQLLTGRLPFPGVTSRARMAAASAYAEGRVELTLPEALSPQWRRFIADCLAPDHAGRASHTAAELRSRAAAAAGTGAAADARGGFFASRRAVATAGSIAMASCVAALALWAPWGGSADAGKQEGYQRYFRTDSDIPPRYYDLIVKAGTKCPNQPVVTPHLVAAVLKTESNFDHTLRDFQKDEYGIARWTPSVLQYYLPEEQKNREPKPEEMSPEVSIPPLGDFLCRFAPELQGVPGDPTLNLVAAWRTSADVVRRANGVPDRPALREYMPRLRANLEAYRPTATS